MPADNYDQATFFPGTRKGNDMVRMWAGRFEWFVGSITEKVWPTMTNAQQVTHQGEFDNSALPVRAKLGPGRTFRPKDAASGRVVDLAPVVRVDQGQIPKLRSLIEVGHARQRRLQRQLRKGIERAEQGGPRGKVPERRQKTRRNLSYRAVPLRNRAVPFHMYRPDRSSSSVPCPRAPP